MTMNEARAVFLRGGKGSKGKKESTIWLNT